MQYTIFNLLKNQCFDSTIQSTSSGAGTNTSASIRWENLLHVTSVASTRRGCATVTRTVLTARTRTSPGAGRGCGARRGSSCAPTASSESAAGRRWCSRLCRCIPGSSRCDGAAQCSDHSDEEGCGRRHLLAVVIALYCHYPEAMLYTCLWQKVWFRFANQTVPQAKPGY